MFIHPKKQLHIGFTLLLCLSILGTLGTVVYGETVSEMSVEERMRISFPDLHEAPWAEPEIRELTLRGVLGGFPDGTFRPNEPIKKIEALVMAVRTLGLEWEAKELEKRDDPQMFTLEGQGLGWAKGYLSAAYRTGLIQSYVQELNWYEPADRAWMATLMVRMIRQEEEARESKYPLYYADQHDMTANQQGYVHVVQKEGLMSGYPDNTFKPKQAMTRAELAVLFTNYFDKYVTDYTLKKDEYGAIEDIDLATQSAVVRTQYNGVQKYRIADRAEVFYQPNIGVTRVVEKRDIDDLQIGQQIEYIVHDRDLVFISIKSDGYNDVYDDQPDYDYNYDYSYDYDSYGETYYVGFVKSLNESNRTLQWEDLAGKSQRYPVASQVEVTDIRGREDDLQIGKLYRAIFQRDRNGERRVVALQQQEEQRKTYTGDLVMVDTYNSKITLRHTQVQSEDFAIPQGVTLSFQSNDYIRMYAYGQYIYDWEILRPMYLEGCFEEYDEDYREIIITDRQDKEQIYRVIEEPRVRAVRSSRTGIDALYKGDYIRMTFDRYDQNNNDIYDEVIEIEVVSQFSGTVVSASSSKVKFIDEFGYERELPVASDPEVQISNRRDASVSDLRSKDEAYFYMEEGKIARIDVYQRFMEEGNIFDIREMSDGSKQLILGQSSYGQRSYRITSSTRIRWQDFKNMSLSELQTGQYVRVYYDGDEATEIERVDMGTVKGQLTDYSDRSIWILVDATSVKRFMLDDDIRSVSSYLNKTVELQFGDDGKVTRIAEAQKEVQKYYIVHIDIDNRTIWLRDEQAKHTIYWLPEDEIVYQGQRRDLRDLQDRVSAKTYVTVEVLNETVVAIGND